MKASLRNRRNDRHSRDFESRAIVSQVLSARHSEANPSDELNQDDPDDEDTITGPLPDKTE